MKPLVTSAALVLLAAAAQDDAPIPKGVELDAWKQLSLEQRWVVFRDSVQNKSGLLINWVAFLDKNDDLELLEYLAIYGGYQGIFQKGHPGEVLVRRDAPQWMRVALWNLRQVDSHSVQAATGPLEQNPGRFMGWYEKFPAVKRLGGAKLVTKFKGVAPEKPGGQLPPLDPMEKILPFLDAPKKLARLDAKTPFDKRKRYRFEVLRAVRAISVAGQFDAPYRGKLLRLIRHADPVVRRTAILEFSEFPAAKVPFAELLALGALESASIEDRKQAVLSASYARHPDVYLALHRILQQPEHPAFATVLQRMFSLGDRFTTKLVEPHLEGDLPQSTMGTIHRLLEHTRKHDPKQNKGPRAVDLLHRSAWAAFREHPLAAELRDWTRAHVKARWSHNDFRKQWRSALNQLDRFGVPGHLHEAIEAEAAECERGVRNRDRR